ncbi:MAG: adenosylcobinamide-GDP ribazoletransferase [Nitrospira sp. CR1.1]|jgi:adenosylcobinamide-GDP ribazoletransferase|nr:adenosylcobinamide-GDP ribazoletransferase [Nitrospira sp. CR1.1]
MKPVSRNVTEIAAMTRPFVFAWHFLTAIPISRHDHAPTGHELAASMAWYSTVGLLIGGLTVLADVGLRSWLAAEVSNALLIVLVVLLTRGLHQDGLADTVDGIAGGRTVEDRLRIMRDPRVGAFGAAALFLSLLLRYAGLLALPAALRLPVLLCMPALGRWAMVSLAWASPSARRDGGLAASFLTHLSWPPVLLSSLVLAVALTIALGGSVAVATMGMGILLLALIRQRCLTLLGGVTGDVLGATNEVIEILFLLLIPALGMAR